MSFRKMIIGLSRYEYSMEVDIRRVDCNPDDAPHWHLYYFGRRIGKIYASGKWGACPDNIDPSIKKEAEELTKKYAMAIVDCYTYNFVHGS